MFNQKGNILVVLAVVAVLAIIAYGMYLQSGGEGDIFQLLFSTLKDSCDVFGGVKDASGNCIR